MRKRTLGISGSKAMTVILLWGANRVLQTRLFARFLQFTRTVFGEESEERKDIASWNDEEYLESFKPNEKLL